MSTFPPKNPPFDVWLETFLSAACPNTEDRRILLAGIRKELEIARKRGAASGREYLRKLDNGDYDE